MPATNARQFDEDFSEVGNCELTISIKPRFARLT